MNATAVALLVNPPPGSHIVYPYTDEGLVGQAVCLFASSGLRANEGVVLIMSRDHCEPIRLRLQLEGLNPETYERSGQLICVESETLLAAFMAGGRLNEELFRRTVGELVERARGSSECPRGVRVFGEMVSQLRGSNGPATERIEELWNDVIQQYSIPLLCTYCLHSDSEQLERRLCELHTHNVESPDTRRALG